MLAQSSEPLPQKEKQIEKEGGLLTDNSMVISGLLILTVEPNLYLLLNKGLDGQQGFPGPVGLTVR